MEIKNLFKSKIHTRIMRFFHENPASIDTARGIATWINQDLGKVRTALNKLVKAGVLISHESGSTTAYTYTRNERIVSRIEKLLQN